MIGHLLGAAGGVESAVCVKTLMEGVIHPTLNFENSDDGLDLDFVPGDARKIEANIVLKNSMGFGGHSAALLFKRFIG